MATRPASPPMQPQGYGGQYGPPMPPQGHGGQYGLPVPPQGYGGQYGPPMPPQSHGGGQHVAPQRKNGLGGLWAMLILIGVLATVTIAGMVKNAVDPRPSDRTSMTRTAPTTESSLFAKVQVKCVGLFSSVSCTVESNGTGPAKACWDVVFGCSSGEHKAHGCSGLVPSGSTESYTLNTIEPPLRDGETCSTSKIQNVEMK